MSKTVDELFSNYPFTGSTMSQDQDRIDNIRSLFQRAADECLRQTGVNVKVAVEKTADSSAEFHAADKPGFQKIYDELVDCDATPLANKFNIGDIVIFNSGGTAMNVSNVNNYYPVVECVWTDEMGHYYCEIVPESCLRLYQEGSN